jgi:hypothetical protein
VVVPLYTAETLLWPYINERRVILVLPVLVAWYAIGARSIAAAVVGWGVSRWRWRPALAWGALGGLALAAVVVPVTSQFSRDYLFGDGQDSPHPGGSRYMAVLAAAPDARAVVETDYESTVGLFTGHPTADTAFLANLTGPSGLNSCASAEVTAAGLAADGAGYLLIGALNKPGVIDNPCLETYAGQGPWAVRLLQAARDEAAVFELVGPGTAHPDLVNLVAGAQPSGAPVGPDGQAFVWSWGSARRVTQVAVGEAGAANAATAGAGAVTAVEVDLLTAGGAWSRVASVPRAVGDGRGDAPFLLVSFRPPPSAKAVRVVVRGGSPGAAAVSDVSVLGSVLR